MKATMRPLSNLRNVSVLDWIKMNIVDVTGEIVFVADGMLPITALPNTLVAFHNLATRSQVGGREKARKSALDKAPAH